MVQLIAIVDRDWSIAKNNAIPWSFPEDLAFFRQKTDGSVIIMGRKTFFSLSEHPLPGRKNIVLSKTCPDIPGAEVFPTLEQALSQYSDAWIIGGAMLYNYTLRQRYVDALYITYVRQAYDGDLFLNASYLSDFSFYLLHATRQADFLLGLRC
ncbi:MAG: dihydrofolate reductase [Holosporales bacterium]|jgi:dihydrofolate reductase|nr:dihydrofolate reductase [Holosporales bacterium]